jgi:hypothetical protein
MKVVLVASATLMLAATPTLAKGDQGPRCNVRQLAGEWLTSFRYVEADEDNRLACRIALDKSGAVVRSSCLRNSVTAPPTTVSGKFSVNQGCAIEGTITSGNTTLSVAGEITKGRDMMVGTIWGVDNLFDPIALVRTAGPRSGKPPKPAPPIEEDDEQHLSCAIDDGNLRMEVKLEREITPRPLDPYQFLAWFEAQPGIGYAGGDTVQLALEGTVVGAQTIDTNDDTGEVETEFHYNSRKNRLPEALAKGLGEGDTVSILKGGVEVLSCALAPTEDDGDDDDDEGDDD